MNQVEILMAEDSLTQAMKLQYFLEQQGFRTTVARNGRQALENLQNRAPGELPTMVISDIEMPEMDGYALCRHIKEEPKFRDLPVMLLTSLSDPADVVTGLESGADNFVVKPYDEEFLLSRIHYILKNKALRDGRAPHAGDGIEVFFAGNKHVLSSAPSVQRTLDLLLGTYETAIQKNQELMRAKQVLEEQKKMLEIQGEELRQTNEAMQSDLDLAREIQQSFLPRQYPSFPHDVMPAESTLHFCHRWIPTTTLGGDFFDVLAISDHEAGVFICDVMGHGVRSALVTALVRALVGERTGMATQPGPFLGEINRHLLGILQETRTPMFASAFYLVINTESGEMHYANAGHPAPLWLRRKIGVVEPLPKALELSGPALGVFGEADFETISYELEERDFIMLFTDGLFEVEADQDAENSAGHDADSEYGEDRVQEFVGRHLELPPDTLFAALLSDIQRHSGGREFEDDMCMIGVEVARLDAMRK